MTENESVAENLTDIEKAKTETELLSAQQELFLRYLAIGGLVTYETDDPEQVQDIHKMPLKEFLKQTGISESTFYRWKKRPGLAEDVRDKRNEIFGVGRETALFNRAYLIAMTSKDHKAAGAMITMLLGHGAKLELPVQRQEVEHKGESWTNLIEQKERQAIEAEIVNDPQINNT